MINSETAELSVGPQRNPRPRAPIYLVRNGLIVALVLLIVGAFVTSPSATNDAVTLTNQRISDQEDTTDAPDTRATGSEGTETAEVRSPVDTTTEIPENGILGETLLAANETQSGNGSYVVDPTQIGVAPKGALEGLLTFRGSPTRTFYGRGPVPETPEVHWRYPQDGGLCASSLVGGDQQIWCGTGWTGQPAMFRLDGRLWAVFGALDGAVHFVDAETGERLIRPYQTNDIIKGSVTVDPDGFPLVYVGSRDGGYRIISFDQGEPREVWKLDAAAGGETLWNDDWDGAGLVIDDRLFVGGENSRIHIVELNRAWGPNGEATVSPELVFSAPGWDDELLAAIGDENVSIENSVTISGNTMYFANSGGLVQGWDLAPLRTGRDPVRTFRYWVGDDVDATVVVDAHGMLYVAAEYERETSRARELGQLLKLDPSASADDALVWSVEEQQGVGTGIWGTPALHDGAVIFGSEGGHLRAVDQATGADLWSIDIGFHLWQSPVVVDDVLLMGDCSGTMHAFDVADVRSVPQRVWSVQLDDGCIESTPAVWDGTIVVGTRSGAVYGIAE